MNSETPLPLFCQCLSAFAKHLSPIWHNLSTTLKLAVCPFKDLHVQDNSLKTKYDILQFVSYDIIAKIVQTDLAQVRKTKDMDKKTKKIQLPKAKID